MLAMFARTCAKIIVRFIGTLAMRSDSVHIVVLQYR